MRLPAGSLDRRVAILRKGEPMHDGFTKTPGAEAVFAERWASVKPARGSEIVEFHGREGRMVMSFWLRFDEVTRTIVETDALDFEGRRFELVAPAMEIGRREGIELLGVARDVQ